MKHITHARFIKIQDDAHDTADSVRGCRNKFKRYNELVINECQRLAREVSRKATIKTGFYIVYTEKQNLGTKSYPDIVITYQTKFVRDSLVRETEKSLIIELKQFKTVIPKEKIICYVW